MASGNFISLLKDVDCPDATDGQGNPNLPHRGDVVVLSNHMVDLLLCAKCTSTPSGANVSFTLEHSPDGTTGSFSAVTNEAGAAIAFECISGDACNCAIIDVPLLPYVIATCIQGGSATTLCNLDLYYRTQK